MHMLSRNLAELETVRVSRIPTTVITANGEMQTNEEAAVYVYDLDLFVAAHIARIRLQSSRLENSAEITDIHMSGPVFKIHTLLNMAETSNATRRTLYRLLSQDYRQVLPARLLVRLQHRYRRMQLKTLRPATMRRRSTSSPVLGDQLRGSEQSEYDNKDTVSVQGDLLRDLPEWLVGGFHRKS